jgi:hypothetical protein
MEDKIDIVDHINNTLRKHPVGGWSVIVFLGLMGIATLTNSIIGIIKALKP